jgi:F-type H+-transporting ATPase subunit alpha
MPPPALDSVPVDKINAFEAGLYRFMEANHPGVGKTITVEKALSAETEISLKAAIQEYKKAVTF